MSKIKKQIKNEVNDNSRKLRCIVIIAKLDDGTCRELLINEQTQHAVLSTIIAYEGRIRILETILEGIEIKLNS